MIDLILTTRNRLEGLKETLASFVANTSFELVEKLIIVNDGSDDGTEQFLENYYRNLKQIMNKMYLCDVINMVIKIHNGNGHCNFNIASKQGSVPDRRLQAVASSI